MNPARLSIVNSLLNLNPPIRTWRMNRALLVWAGATIGDNVRIVSSARIHTAGTISIGSETWIGHEVMIVCGNASVYIGAKVNIGRRVTLVTGSHLIDTESGRAAGGGISKPIIIDDGV
jgi:acetyltransferase-like isoleucine patch superfamily enzyme